MKPHNELTAVAGPGGSQRGQRVESNKLEQRKNNSWVLALYLVLRHRYLNPCVCTHCLEKIVTVFVDSAYCGNLTSYKGKDLDPLTFL